MAETFGLAVNVVAVVELFLQIGVQCSAYCQEVKSAPREVRDILREADRGSATLRELDRALSGADGFRIKDSQSVTQSLVDFKEQLEDLAAKLDPGLRQKGWQLIWPLKKGQATEKVRQLRRCRESIALDLQVYQIMLSTKSQTESVIEKLRIAKHATFDAEVDDLYARCLPGTRAEILQRILDWSTADGEDIFWLSGMAGTGKSTISRTIAEMLKDRGILGASFFFKRGEGDRSRATLLFPTVASQLVRQQPELGGPICHEIEADADIHDKSLKTQFERLFVNPLSSLQQQPASGQRPPTVAIVVDALDEADNPDHARLLIHFMSQARHLRALHFKFFVTSRPEFRIRCGFEDLQGKYENLVLHEIPKPVVEHDIAVFFDYELARIREDFNRYAPSEYRLAADWPGPERTTQLVNMAVPLFIYATTVCLFLQERRLGGPEDQLAHIIRRQGTASDKMEATYLPLLDRFFAGLSEQDMSEVAMRFQQVIGSIVVLASPLSVSSLSCLLGMSVERIEDLLEDFYSVLSVPQNRSDPLRLLHKSFRDFLVDSEMTRDPLERVFHVDEQETHGRLAGQCLRLLSTEGVLKQDICNLKEPGAARSDLPLGIIDKCLPPEVQYACQFWVLHWKAGHRTIRKGDIVDRFLTRYLLYWLEALAWLGRITETVHMVNDLLGSLDPGDSDSIASLLGDVLRVILAHRSGIESWPLQIYCSALVFTPQRSPVRQIFRDHFPAWLTTPPRTEPDWDGCTLTLLGHRKGVACAALSSDRTLLASGSSDCDVKLWDRVTGDCVATLQGHDGGVCSLVFFPGLPRLASVSLDRTMRIWDIETGDCILTLEGHGTKVTAVAVSQRPCRLAFGEPPYCLKVWDEATGAVKETVIPNVTYKDDGKGFVAISPDARLVAMASPDTVTVWTAETCALESTLRPPSDVNDTRYLACAFSPDSRYLASLDSSGALKFWEPETAECLRILICGRGSRLRKAAFTPDLAFLAFIDKEDSVVVCDTATGTLRAIFRHPKCLLSSFSISADTSFLVSTSEQGLKMWDTKVAYLNDPEEGPHDVDYVVFSPDASRFAAIAEFTHGCGTLWDASANTCIATLNQGGGATRVAFSPDSSRLASWCRKGIMVWDSAQGTHITTIKLYKTLAHHQLAFSPDSSYLATFASSDSTVRLWSLAPSLEAAAQVAELAHGNTVTAMALSPDSRKVASGSEMGTVKLWAAATGGAFARTLILAGHASATQTLAFSPDSNRLASGGSDLAVMVWDVTSGACVATFQLTSRNNLTRSLSTMFSSDSLYLASKTDNWVELCHVAEDASSPARWPISNRHRWDGRFDIRRVDSDMTGLKIHTTHGVVAAARHSAGGDVQVEHEGLGLSDDREWVLYNSRRMIWLPPTYRVSNFQICLSRMGITCASGRLIALEISL